MSRPVYTVDLSPREALPVKPHGWSIGTTLACAVLGLLLYLIGCLLIGQGGRL
jgi:hypothetical protein